MHTVDNNKKSILNKNEDESVLTFADLTVIYLKYIGVEYVFGVPGGAIAPLYDALARSQRRGPDWPKAIIARHETGAAFMADGYARETRRIGVCCSTTGPGATNLITGVASAYANHIPMLVITAQTKLASFGRGAFQESSPDALDIEGMFEHCTNYSTIISHPEQFERKLIDAIASALRHPQGPTHLSIPIDVFNSPISRSQIEAKHVYLANLKKFLVEPTLIDQIALDRLCEKMLYVLKKQQQIVLLIGGDCTGSVVDHVIKFAELINAPIVTTPEGKSWVNSDHPLYYGVFGFAGHKSARSVVAQDSVGLILAAGTNLDEWSTDGWNDVLLNSKLVHIYHATDYFARSYMACLQVCGDITLIFQKLHNKLREQLEAHQLDLSWIPLDDTNPSGSERRMKGLQCAPRHIEIDHPEKYRKNSHTISLPVKPQRLMCELTQNFPPETRFFADTGNSFAWSTHYLFHKAANNYRIAMGLGCMGWAIGAAVGTALAAPDKPVVCITGDGSFLMSGQELTVAVEHRLSVIFVILNDHSLGMVKHGQRLSGAEPIGFEIVPVDFAMMAKSVGAKSYIIRVPKDFEQIDYEEIYSRREPTLLDVRIDPEEPPPMGLRVRII